MSRHLLIAGTGKMALDLAGFFAERGWGVTLRSRSFEGPARVDKVLVRIRRRRGPGQDELGPRCLGPDAALPRVDLAIESTIEDLAEKRRVLVELAAIVPEDVPLASNSSSLRPSAIHARCMGLHFFHPAFLTRLVEWVVPDSIPGPARQRAETVLRELGLDVVRETEEHAFAANRLLLPVQVACARALLAGIAPAAIDAAALEAGFARGPLATMDAIGLAVMLPAVRSYARGDELAPLEEVLRVALAAGRLGTRSGDGLILGAPLPGGGTAPAPARFGSDLRALLRRTCQDFVARGELSREDLDLVTRRAFGIDWALS